ncbi:LOW QUALITY PROTEIN: hypothetical protein HID58_070398 [Brassica napus]|uniref:IBB domain-containing protein n=1 Tax=Brassica napus TaxID=3708 RepID=A0ABQ7YYT3_BRANA|nr:LOW QUALITY PROTEIN: hypothetical protein HID58_070398 [Brassica napus]
MAVDSEEGRMRREDNMVEIWKSKSKRAFAQEAASSIHTETSIRFFSIASDSSIENKLESLLSIVGGVWSENRTLKIETKPKTSSTTVSGKSRGDSVAVSGVEGKKKETRGLGLHSKWWLTAAELRSLKAAWFCY